MADKPKARRTAKTPRAAKPARRYQIEATKHRTDKRANIPTRELSDFVRVAEAKPDIAAYPGLLYARDPSLDPQLVWKGKDEQDQHPLEVPVVPVYIQEKIAPKTLIDDLRAAQNGARPAQAELFADFNGLEFEDLIEFYQHEQHWSNRLILGDSLLVMASLAEKEGLKGKVQMIYLDPPYGIKFGSNWQVSTRKRDVKDGKVEDLAREPEVIRAFRDTWELGIHSYLSYLRDRFIVARDLLTESGSIFVQIGDENVHLVRSVLDEVFGSGNFCSIVVFQKTTGQTAELLASTADLLLWYAKDRASIKYRQVFLEKGAGAAGAGQYWFVELEDGTRRRMTPAEMTDPAQLPVSAKVFAHAGTSSQTRGGTEPQPFRFDGKVFHPERSRGWSTSITGLQRLAAAGRLMVAGNTLRFVRYLADFPLYPLTAQWSDTGISGFARKKQYAVETDPSIIARCLLMTTDPGDLVLDPTCGSGTTAFVAEQWGRRWITIDTSRVALTLARTRLMTAKFPYYLLADSPEGVAQEAEVRGQAPPSPLPKTEGDIKKGFVYRRVPHVTLKSIANNPDITEGMTRAEIDAAIARHADTELLYDQPYQDKKRIRVTGPFTVESLSPHRVLATDPDRPASERDADRAPGAGQFELRIIENLRKAGVQNTVKQERLTFDRLDSFAGAWLHAAGEYTALPETQGGDPDRSGGAEGGKTKRVAVCIGPEHGTVGPELVKEAAKEAVKGIGFDLLLICGFAFDPHINEEVKEYGDLTVLPVRMNNDLMMPDEVLKKTGAGNLFMVFGEPDLEVTPQNGQVTVEIRGVDVYDPTSGQIRSHATDDIACWFIDTDYNGESFFVRHAYFCGGGEPYERLKRALRADIDEAAWSELYSTTSRPFPRPGSGRIAVKVINHYGDEVLKVYEV